MLPLDDLIVFERLLEDRARAVMAWPIVVKPAFASDFDRLTRDVQCSFASRIDQLVAVSVMVRHRREVYR